MKTGKEVLERALKLLGYTNTRGEPDGVRDAALFKRGTAAVIQIYDDLKRIDRLGSRSAYIKGMNDQLELSPETIDDVMPYGVAMLLSQNEGDGDSQALFTALYSLKRVSVPRKNICRIDKLPRGGY
ncbi:MAG: hypothetical protein PHP68_00505 [Oscillospiraceae bacterium]|nr:hypothetical protein [Oscillospiraceae bacterium]